MLNPEGFALLCHEILLIAKPCITLTLASAGSQESFVMVDVQLHSLTWHTIHAAGVYQPSLRFPWLIESQK